MTESFTPAGCAEFPHDNPALHGGVRWVCPEACGPARALRRASSEGAGTDAGAALQPAKPAAPARSARRLDGPLQLDLGRIVLLHRVEDVPPPPDFIYEPFVPSRQRPPASSSRPIHPRPCRVVDAREAGQRIQRGWRVDVAPCLDVGASERRPSRHRGGMVSCPAPRSPEPELELQVASA